MDRTKERITETIFRDMHIRGQIAWLKQYEHQKRKCAKCGKFMRLTDSRKSPYSLKPLECKKCFEKKNYIIILDECQHIPEEL